MWPLVLEPVSHKETYMDIALNRRNSDLFPLKVKIVPSSLKSPGGTATVLAKTQIVMKQHKVNDQTVRANARAIRFVSENRRKA